MSVQKTERNKLVVLAIKGGQSVSQVAKHLKMAKSTISVIWNRDKDKWGRKKFKDPSDSPVVRSLSPRKREKVLVRS